MSGPPTSAAAGNCAALKVVESLQGERSITNAERVVETVVVEERRVTP